MWKWTNEEHTVAIMQDGEMFIQCGINAEPLASWLAEGNIPEEYDNGM